MSTLQDNRQSAASLWDDAVEGVLSDQGADEIEDLASRFIGWLGSDWTTPEEDPSYD